MLTLPTWLKGHAAVALVRGGSRSPAHLVIWQLELSAQGSCVVMDVLRGRRCGTEGSGCTAHRAASCCLTGQLVERDVDEQGGEEA